MLPSVQPKFIYVCRDNFLHCIYLSVPIAMVNTGAPFALVTTACHYNMATHARTLTQHTCVTPTRHSRVALLRPRPQLASHGHSPPSRNARITLTAAASKSAPRPRDTRPDAATAPSPSAPVAPACDDHDERAVIAATASYYMDGRYGKCPQCDGALAVPGLAQMLCAACGWVDRPVETVTISPGHHD